MKSCWETKVATGTVLEPRGAGVADARGRRAASPGWVGGKSETFVKAVGGFNLFFSVLLSLASVSARPSLARRPRSGVVAQGVRRAGATRR